MTPLAIGTGLAILAILGLIVGLVVLLVVISLFKAILTPAREISHHARQAPEVAPFLANGVQGAEELRRTRELANQVPPLALAYLEKVQGGSPAPTGPAASAGGAAPAAASAGPVGRISGGKP